MRVSIRCAAALGLMTLGLFLPAAMSDTPTPSQPTAVSAQKGVAQPELTLKVFRLERADPAAVVNALTNLLEDATTFRVEPSTKGQQPAVPAGAGGLGAGALGNAFCGFGGMPGTSIVNWRAATDDRVRLIAVRGAERHLAVATDVVAVLDRPANNAPLPKLTAVRAFALKHTTPADVVRFVSELDFAGLRQHDANERLLLCTGPEAHLKAVNEIVQALDVADKTPATEGK